MIRGRLRRWDGWRVSARGRGLRAGVTVPAESASSF